MSDRVTFVMLKLSGRCNIHVNQASTATPPDEEIDQFSKDLSKMRRELELKVVTGDFNTKIGQKNETDPPNVGNFGLGTRNVRGQMMLHCLSKEGSFCMNNVFLTPPQRQWFCRTLAAQSRTRLTL